MALLFTSSEIEETLGVCDRILVFYKGRVVSEFARGEATKADVMRWITGEMDDDGTAVSHQLGSLATSRTTAPEVRHR